ncbi:MAG: repair protein RecN [Fimbriimonadaceae bacterium]|jgi:DNA repair protein RecN (Recombination protein N)|nr:repair protein RecN [Fimbriimonadaceae bacterium]
MILELSVENLAIIEKAQISLGPGFTVLTGETGAGKSLLVDALELALGERADTELVRTGAPRANVSVVIDLSTQPALVKRCQEEGISLDDSSLFIQREVFAEGRSQSRIGGKLTPISALKQIGSLLVDLHGQHAHQSLLDAERHLGYLDLWIGKPALDLLGKIAQAYAAAEEARRRLNILQASMRDREHRLDLLRFQVNEIEDANPQVGELEELDAQLVKLRNSERLATAAFAALQLLQEKEGCAVENLGSAVKTLDDAHKFDPDIASVLEPLMAALYSLEEGSHSLRSYADGIESDPAVLEEVAGRIDSLKRLRRKYGENEFAVLAFLERARTELDELQDAETNEANLADVAAAADNELVGHCADLSLLRHERADEFAALVEKELQDLAMDRAVFQVRVATKTPCNDGADKVEFFFSANAGEVPRPLAKIASGGEISRVMLGIKTVLAGKAGVPTLIFDEVDAGLSGRVAAVLGSKLEELAQHYQVVVISHLPQIASRATTHYRIEKIEKAGRVVTQVRLLKPKERIEEIARMLAGELVTESARKNARDLLSGVARAS